MKKNFFYPFFLVLLIIGGCASEQKEETSEKVYSDETNRTFEMIERGYNAPPLRKAPTQMAAPQVTAPTHYEKPEPRKKKITSPSATAAAPSKSSNKMPEKLIELNQNLAFYCMKHRKNPTFNNDEKKCMDYVGKILDNCQEISAQVHSKLLACVKKKLNNKI